MDLAERRKHRRVPYGAWVEDESQGQGLQFYLAENLSLSGLLLRANGTPPPLGRCLHLRLVVENESRIMSVEGEVVRHVEGMEGGFAVRFANLDPARAAFLSDLVDELSRSHTEH